MTELRPSTVALDEIYYRRHVAPYFGTTPLRMLDRTVLRQWVADLIDPAGSELAPATVCKIVQILNKAVRAALEDRLIVVNPVDRLPLPKIEREEMRFISHDEVHHLASVFDPRYRALVLLAGYGGLRLGELVFRSPDGKPIRASLFRKRYWTPAVNAAGLAPLRIHDLGHSAVSLWIAAGANPKQIAARAGHTSVSVVLDRYGHLYPDHDISLIGTLEAHAQRAAMR